MDEEQDNTNYGKLFHEVSFLVSEFIPDSSNITVADGIRLMRDEIYRWRLGNNMSIETPTQEEL